MQENDSAQQSLPLEGQRAFRYRPTLYSLQTKKALQEQAATWAVLSRDCSKR